VRYLKVFLLSLLAVGLVLGTAPAQAQMAERNTYQGPSELSNAVQFGGYFELEYEDTENGNGNLDNHRTILFFGAQPHERLTFFNELEIEHGGAPDIKLEQSWLEFALGGGQNFRAGIDLIPVGRLNINHDGNLRDFVFRPYVDGNIIPTTWFESALEFNGNITQNLSYQVGVSNGMNESSPGSVGSQGEIASMVGLGLAEGDDDGSKATYGRFAWSPLLGTEIALSGYSTPYDEAGNKITFAALDFNTIMGPWEFTGELVDVSKDQQTASEPGSADPDNDGFLEHDTNVADLNGNGMLGDQVSGIKGASGVRLEAAYHFFPDFMYDSWLARGFDNPTFTALARYEQLGYDEPSSMSGSLDESYYSVGFNYRPIERVAYKFSYDIHNADDPSVVTENDRFGFGAVIGF
jgi:hypothetical protein